MPIPRRGEVWLVDLGLAAKTRPCLIVSVPVSDEDRALVTVLAHTTSPRGSRFEVPTDVRYLRSGVFDAQSLTTIPLARALRRLGVLPHNLMIAVESALGRWLGLTSTSDSHPPVF